MKTETKYIATNQRIDDDEVQQKKVVTTEDERLTVAEKTANIIYAVAGIITGLIAIRFLLLLFGANQNNTFAELIYGMSEPFVRPFYGLFGSNYSIENISFELESIIAIAFIALVAWAIVKILTISRPQEQS